MAIEKLFHALVLGGVSMGVQACTPKKAQTKDPVETTETTTQETSTTSPKEASPEEEATRPAESQERPVSKWGMEKNSKGEKCEDVCTQESSGEIICSEMCCWLQAVECCPDYRPPPEEEK